MAYVNSVGNVVMYDWDNDSDAGASAYAITGLLSGQDITIKLLRGGELEVGKFTDQSWDFYDQQTLYDIGDSVVFLLDSSESLVLFSSNSAEITEASVSYTVEEPDDVDLYAQPSIVPAAVSSELDESGEERIHIAPYADAMEVN